MMSTKFGVLNPSTIQRSTKPDGGQCPVCNLSRLRGSGGDCRSGEFQTDSAAADGRFSDGADGDSGEGAAGRVFWADQGVSGDAAGGADDADGSEKGGDRAGGTAPDPGNSGAFRCGARWQADTAGLVR